MARPPPPKATPYPMPQPPSTNVTALVQVCPLLLAQKTLIDVKGVRHILSGDETGGGHRAGTGEPETSEFPKNWPDEKILGHISDIVTDPAARSHEGNSKKLYDIKGRPIRNAVYGVRDGVEIKIVFEPATGRVVTAFPVRIVDPSTGQLVPAPLNPPYKRYSSSRKP
jgi:hypothetical protein